MSENNPPKEEVVESPEPEPAPAESPAPAQEDEAESLAQEVTSPAPAPEAKAESPAPEDEAETTAHEAESETLAPAPAPDPDPTEEGESLAPAQAEQPGQSKADSQAQETGAEAAEATTAPNHEADEQSPVKENPPTPTTAATTTATAASTTPQAQTEDAEVVPAKKEEEEKQQKEEKEKQQKQPTTPKSPSKKKRNVYKFLKIEETKRGKTTNPFLSPTNNMLDSALLQLIIDHQPFNCKRGTVVTSWSNFIKQHLTSDNLKCVHPTSGEVQEELQLFPNGPPTYKALRARFDDIINWLLKYDGKIPYKSGIRDEPIPKHLISVLLNLHEVYTGYLAQQQEEKHNAVREFIDKRNNTKDQQIIGMGIVNPPKPKKSKRKASEMMYQQHLQMQQQHQQQQQQMYNASDHYQYNNVVGVDTGMPLMANPIAEREKAGRLSYPFTNYVPRQEQSPVPMVGDDMKKKRSAYSSALRGAGGSGGGGGGIGGAINQVSKAFLRGVMDNNFVGIVDGIDDNGIDGTQRPTALSKAIDKLANVIIKAANALEMNNLNKLKKQKFQFVTEQMDNERKQQQQQNQQQQQQEEEEQESEIDSLNKKFQSLDLLYTERIHEIDSEIQRLSFERRQLKFVGHI